MNEDKPKTQLAFTARHNATTFATVHKFLTANGQTISSRNGVNAAGFNYLAALIEENMPELVVRDLNSATEYLRDAGLIAIDKQNREQKRLIKSLALESQTATRIPEDAEDIHSEAVKMLKALKSDKPQLGESRMNDVTGVLGDISGLMEDDTNE